MAWKDVVPQPNKQWGLIVLFGLLMLVGGIGTCSKYVPIGPPGPTPTPIPQPGPSPEPAPNGNPNTVWQPLEPPLTNAVTGLELPPLTQISVTRKYVIVAAKSQSRVRWLISSRSGTPVDALESPLTNSVLIFTTGKPNDVLMVLAYAVTPANTASDPAVTLITLTNDAPPPEPGPDPAPPPEPTSKFPSKLHVTFVLDFNKQTRAISDVINNPELRQWLNAQGHKVHEVSIREASNYNLDTFIEGKAAPLLVLQTQAVDGYKEGSLVDGGVTQLYSIQGVKDAVLKATGKTAGKEK